MKRFLTSRGSNRPVEATNLVPEPAATGRRSDIEFEEDDLDHQNGVFPSQRIVYKRENRNSRSAEQHGRGRRGGRTTPAKLKRKIGPPEDLERTGASPENLLDAWMLSKKTKRKDDHGDSLSTSRSEEDRPVRAAASIRDCTPIQDTISQINQLHKKTFQGNAKTEDLRVLPEDSARTSQQADDRHYSSDGKENLPDLGLQLVCTQKEEPGEDLFDEALLELVHRVEVNRAPEEKRSSSFCTERLVVRDLERSASSTSLWVSGATENGPQQVVRVVLCDQWCDTEVDVDTMLRIVFVQNGKLAGPPNPPADIVVDKDQNLLIVHPDVLLNGTTIASSFPCVRKSVLMDRNKAVHGYESKAALRGTLAHCLFQKALTIAPSYVNRREDMRRCLYDMKEAEACEFLQSTIKGIMQFVDSYLYGSKAINSGKSSRRLGVNSVLAIEESIWSPVFGLKGKIDATLKIRVDDEAESFAALEFKTGRVGSGRKVYHTAQLLIYSLLLSERYDSSVEQGVLTYISGNNKTAGKENESQDGEHSILVASKRPELVGLVTQRNQLAKYMTQEAIAEGAIDLPPILQGYENLCKSCFAVDNCVIQNRLLEGGAPSSRNGSVGPGAAIYNEKTGHILPEHAEFYKLWRTKIAGEERHAERSRKEIWTIMAEDRERDGHCLGNLMLCEKVRSMDSPTQAAGENGQGGWGQPLTFQRRDRDSNVPLTSRGIEVGDHVVVSLLTQDHGQSSGHLHTALGSGFVRQLWKELVSVESHDDIWDIARRRQWLGPGNSAATTAWRIDKDELSSGFYLAKDNLENLFLPRRFEFCSKLRSLIVDLRGPVFSPAPSETTKSLGSEHLEALNPAQQAAIHRTEAAEDYSLLLGMPGTGKTDTIVALIKRCVAAGESVLLVGFTHASVDNVLVRLLQSGEKRFLRLGRQGQVDPRLHRNMEEAVETVEEYAKHVETPKIIASSCMGIRHPVFRRRRFDTVVVDEAGQVSLPFSLGPLLFCKSKFVLVGDHFQLPPLTKCPGNSDTANDSLFKRLCDAHPSGVSTLNYQYRMAEDIMQLSNRLVYNGAMLCGNSSVANQTLNVSKVDEELLAQSEFNKNIFAAGENVSWLRRVLLPENRVVFIDTDTVNGLEDRKPSAGASTVIASRSNSVEVGLVMGVCASLKMRGVELKDVGVVSPYRAQIFKMKKAANSVLGGLASGVDVRTIDQFQGCDRKCIIISFVRSNPQMKVGDLLRDWRRINVAITRARAKLIMVGSSSTLKGGCSFLSRLISVLEEKSWIVPSTAVPEFSVPSPSIDAPVGSCELMGGGKNRTLSNIVQANAS